MRRYLTVAAALATTLVVPPTQSAGQAQFDSGFDYGSYWCSDSPTHLLVVATFYYGLTGTATGL